MGVNIQTIKDIRFYLVKELEEIYQEPEKSSIINIIIKTVTGISRLHQLYKTDSGITVSQAQKIIEICIELKTGKPIQYIVGETTFYDTRIKVNGATLIPRPETEELVDLIIKENRDFKNKVLDIGTGSGCIAIALALKMPESSVTGTDIYEDALTVARENAVLNNVHVSFFQDDIFNFKNYNLGEFAIIVSNPPYVRMSEIKHMNKNVLDFEPHKALFVNDNDPLVYYKAILKIAEKILIPAGRLYFEINEAFGSLMVNLLESAGYSEVAIVEDINGKERIIKGRKNV
jgi:release factor glutamine methyltransferase